MHWISIQDLDCEARQLHLIPSDSIRWKGVIPFQKQQGMWRISQNRRMRFSGCLSKRQSCANYRSHQQATSCNICPPFMHPSIVSVRFASHIFQTADFDKATTNWSWLCLWSIALKFRDAWRTRSLNFSWSTLERAYSCDMRTTSPVPHGFALLWACRRLGRRLGHRRWLLWSFLNHLSWLPGRWLGWPARSLPDVKMDLYGAMAFWWRCSLKTIHWNYSYIILHYTWVN